jgi:C1A family cysteine protease
MYVPKLGGWKADHEDPDHDASKNYVFADNISKFAAASPAGAPQEVDGVLDLRQWCSPVEAQGQIGSCVGNGVVGALEFLQIRNGKPFVDLSRMFVYYNARLMSRMQDRDEGAYIHMAFGTLSSLGTCAEEKWPYDTSKVFIRPSWGSYRDAYVNKIDSYYSIGGSGQAQKNYIISALQASHPIVFGMTVDKDYMAYRGGPPVAMPKSVRAGAGGHCQVIVGYDLGRELWLVRNSWGTWWGDDGYAWVPFKYLDESSANSFWVPFLEGT